jgi:hypothetical protein
MPIETALQRVAAIEALVERARTAVHGPAQPATATAAPTAFGPVLERALVPATTLPGASAPPGGAASAEASPEDTGTVLESPGVRSLSAYGVFGDTPGRRALAAAQREIGVREEPPGSNDAPRIAEYRTATAGSAPGVPWCAYFVSWAAARAGAPVGEQGQGYGAVEQIDAWAQRTGRLVPAGMSPEPGDLILFGGRHIGIVESVSPDGRLTTVEGNHRDAVERVQRHVSDATGFVRL